jgi:hypothetical protein
MKESTKKELKTTNQEIFSAATAIEFIEMKSNEHLTEKELSELVAARELLEQAYERINNIFRK